MQEMGDGRVIWRGDRPRSDTNTRNGAPYAFIYKGRELEPRVSTSPIQGRF